MPIPRFQTVKENISFKDVLFTGAPTAGTYTGYVNGYLNDLLPSWLIHNSWLALTITLFLFLILLGVLYYFNSEAHKKSLAEVLATGYYLNFSGKLSSLLKQESDITFSRKTGALTVKPGKVKLKLILPLSKNELETISSSIDENSEIGYIDTKPFVEPNLWLKIKADTESGAVTIYEFPRTLFALPHYLSSEYTESNSKKIHQAFNKKFIQLVADNPDKKPPLSRFEIIYDLK